jgi:hypothetical protein
MWRPKTEADIKVGTENGTTVETASFDAKRELPAPGKNKDLAKDICAMTVDGGTLLYGLGGENPTRPDQLSPFETAGVRERIDAVIHSAIEETPVVDVYDIDSEEVPGKGYVCVVIPPSPRAPHMLTSDGDGRFWGRGETGNRILSENEVARLYERRGEWEADRQEQLTEAVAAYPFQFDPATNGVVLVTVRPVAAGRELLRIAAGEASIAQFLAGEMTDRARERDPYPLQGTSGLGEAFNVGSAQADQWIASNTNDRESRYQALALFFVDGTFCYWHSPVLNSRNGEVYFVMEQSVTRALCQPLVVAEWLYDAAGFFGSVDIGLAVLGLGGVGGATRIQGFEMPTYGAAEYRRSERVTGEELRSGRDDITRRLLRPLYEVISLANYDPLAERLQ